MQIFFDAVAGLLCKSDFSVEFIIFNNLIGMKLREKNVPHFFEISCYQMKFFSFKRKILIIA